MINRFVRIATDICLRRWPNQVAIVDTETSYLVKRPLPSSVKVNATFIELNYRSLSPFSHATLVYCIDKKDLYLWFIRSEPSDERLDRFLFPESYLLARSFEDNGHPLVVVVEHEVTAEVFVIISGVVVSQLVKKIRNASEVTTLVSLVKREHGLQAPEVFKLTPDEKNERIQRGLRNPALFQLRGFWVSAGKWKEKVPGRLNSLLAAVLSFIMLYIAAQLLGLWYVQREIEQSRIELTEIQESVKSVMAERADAMQKNDFWRTFYKDEIETLHDVEVYYLVSSAVSESTGQILLWRSNHGSISVTVLVDNAAALADELRNTLQLAQIRFSGAVRKDQKSGKEKATVDINLQADRL